MYVCMYGCKSKAENTDDFPRNNSEERKYVACRRKKYATTEGKRVGRNARNVT